MYQGGTTPRQGRGFSHERLHPQLSYDFRAPLGEYGQRRTSYHSLRLLHLFLRDYGENLAPMATRLPQGAEALQPDNTADVRYCVRARDGAGFLFVNNFQDHVARQDIPDVAFEITTAAGPVRIPEAGSLAVPADACFLLPFNQDLDGARLIYATAQPLALLNAGDVHHYVYFAPEGVDAEYCFAKDTVKHLAGDFQPAPGSSQVCVRPTVGQAFAVDLETVSGQHVKLITLTRAEAEHTWKGEAWGAERLIISSAELTFVDGRVEAYAAGVPEWTLRIWPPVAAPLTVSSGTCRQTTDVVQTLVQVSRPPIETPLRVEPVGTRKYLVQMPQGVPAELSELFLQIDYEGDTGMAFIHGDLVADHFSYGVPWIIGLKRFTLAELQQGLCLVFSPLRQGAMQNVSSPLAGRFEFQGQEKLAVHSISALPEYWVTLGIDDAG